MRYSEQKPCVLLDPFVDYFWQLRDAPAHTPERIVPSGTVETSFASNCALHRMLVVASRSSNACC